MRNDAVLGAGFVLMWSSGFVGAVLGTESASAWTLLMWRFVIVALLLLTWWTLRRGHRLPRRELGVHTVIGLLSQGVFLFGIVWSAELGVPAGIAALVAALQPIAAAALSVPLLGERVSRTQWVGLAVGIAGVALVVSGDLAASGSAPKAAYLLPFLAMAGLVAGTFFERKARSTLPLSDALVIQCSVSAVAFTALAGATATITPPLDGQFWTAVAWVVLFSTFGGYGFYWLNVAHGSVNRVSTLLYLTPPTTMVLAWLMFGERISLTGLLGLAVCAVAVATVLRSRREMSVPEEMMATCCSTMSSPPRPGWPPRDPERPRRRSWPNC
ncbi:DMT(drug/metabolite transporter) superfamily permease [Saccharomonospora marina XMU15]|uniref:DMT(Drug/metabolite transporter) superfamily permease n=1 Tax=Saccharomonospora marina XMU15 TaxID=882083 RepID=H5X9Y4_9PSEU|nr:DMT family transporter [Saccharomonospora marina]EHR52622.1 DMT(drug/metabolite transporter) superfamily permease [Saccharomonospora marina XMU15]